MIDIEQLSAFVEARLEEEEAAACAVAPGGRPLEQGRYLEWNAAGVAVGDSAGLVVAYSIQTTAAREHVTRYDPARILAEIEAKRVIVKQAAEASSDRALTIMDRCVGQEEIDRERATDPGVLILKALAALHAGHPDYRREWRP